MACSRLFNRVYLMIKYTLLVARRNISERKHVLLYSTQRMTVHMCMKFVISPVNYGRLLKTKVTSRLLPAMIYVCCSVARKNWKLK